MDKNQAFLNILNKVLIYISDCHDSFKLLTHLNNFTSIHYLTLDLMFIMLVERKENIPDLGFINGVLFMVPEKGIMYLMQKTQTLLH